MLCFSLCVMLLRLFFCFFFFKQKTAYEMRISDWSSDVGSSDLGDIGLGDAVRHGVERKHVALDELGEHIDPLVLAVNRLVELANALAKIGRASCRERVGEYV